MFCASLVLISANTLRLPASGRLPPPPQPASDPVTHTWLDSASLHPNCFHLKSKPTSSLAWKWLPHSSPQPILSTKLKVQLNSKSDSAFVFFVFREQ